MRESLIEERECVLEKARRGRESRVRKSVLKEREQKSGIFRLEGVSRSQCGQT